MKEQEQLKMKEQERLVGIDLFRSLAIYAVLLLHIDEGVKVMPLAWSNITDFSLFAVPFFLATSFYLAINKLYLSRSLYPMRSRLLRLLIPYGVWSVIYLIYKSAKYLVNGQSNEFLQLFQDPLSVIFFGGSSFHLYFLPLLATGTLLIKLVDFLIAKKISLRGLGIIALISLLIYELVLISGNGLKTPDNVAFESLLATVYPSGNSNPLLRWVLVELFWTLKCLPYIMVAMLLNHPTVNQRCLKLINQYSWLWLLIFLVLNAFGALILPQAIYEVARGYIALVAAIAASGQMKYSPLIKNLGLCSFGIYLIHLIFVEIFQSIFIGLYPNYIYDVSTVMLLFISVVILLISWWIIALLMKQKKLYQFLFGS
jgi:peptidoglycan/LPS O-acetylase OafA/YrhL